MRGTFAFLGQRKRNMNRLRLTFALIFVLGVGMAQTYSQPVREVEKEAYTAVAANCFLSWMPNAQDTLGCDAIAVPGDKILAIRQVSVECNGRTGDVFAGLKLSTLVGSTTFNTAIPLVTAAPPSENYQLGRVATIPVFHHARPGTTVRFRGRFEGQKTSWGFPSHCSCTLQGYFLPAVH